MTDLRVERLRAAIEDAINTLEAMDLYMDNPLYIRLRTALEFDEEYSVDKRS